MRVAILLSLFVLLTVPAKAAPDPVAEAAYVRGDYAGAVAAAARAGGAENLAFAAKALNAISYFDRDRKTTRKRCDEAMDFAEAAIAADPSFAEAHFNLGVAMLIKASNMGAARAFLSNLPARGRRMFDRAIELDPDFAPFLVASAAWRIEVANRGGGFFYGADAEEGYAEMIRARAIDPVDNVIAHECAVRLLADGRAEWRAEALACLDDALAAATDSTFEAAIQEKSRQLKTAIDAGPEAEKAFLSRRR
jgi:tetratricopeptide (TPR) repeat protein